MSKDLAIGYVFRCRSSGIGAAWLSRSIPICSAPGASEDCLRSPCRGTLLYAKRITEEQNERRSWETVIDAWEAASDEREASVL